MRTNRATSVFLFPISPMIARILSFFLPILLHVDADTQVRACCLHIEHPPSVPDLASVSHSERVVSSFKVKLLKRQLDHLQQKQNTYSTWHVAGTEKQEDNIRCFKEGLFHFYIFNPYLPAALKCMSLHSRNVSLHEYMSHVKKLFLLLKGCGAPYIERCTNHLWEQCSLQPLNSLLLVNSERLSL